MAVRSARVHATHQRFDECPNPLCHRTDFLRVSSRRAEGTSTFEGKVCRWGGHLYLHPNGGER